jgi:hypothetical protein
LVDRSRYRQAVHKELEKASLGKAIVWRGDVLTLGPKMTLHVLFPPAGFDARVADDKALILRLDVENVGGKPGNPQPGPMRILLTSNAGFVSEHWLLEHAPKDELRSDIIIKGMHAKDLSGTAEFLAAVHPTLVVTSAGEFPAAQRVSENWAAMVQAHGIRLLRQDETGAVNIAVERDGTWSAEPFLKPKGEGVEVKEKTESTSAPSAAITTIPVQNGDTEE